MLVLFESPAGYAVFKLLDESKLQETENLFKDFETPEGASKVVKLKHFEKFKDMQEAVSASAALIEGKVTKSFRKVLKKLIAKEAHDSLAVADAKLGNVLKEKLGLSCVSNSSIHELMRCIRSQMENLISSLPKKEMTAMALGLAHGLSRYKLKFSPDKIDTMIIQAVSLLDDLDKELNNYIMRCKEWYGWHFPELSKLIPDNHLYISVIKLMKMRTNAAELDFSELLQPDDEAKLKELAEISMGTEISEDDMQNILYLCSEILEMSKYRNQLSEYLKNRMMAVAPNLTILVGELVGARLISHAGSLINLAKHPASTVQILGAEKALFRALKAKHDTPKYGLIYHAALVGQSSAKLKGKVSRMLAAKASLACRVDALGEETNNELGIEHRAKLEARMKFLEEGGTRRVSGTGKGKAKWEKYESKSQVFEYSAAGDSTIPSSKKRKFDMDEDEAVETKPKKIKAEPVKEEVPEAEEEPKPGTSEKKKKKKRKQSESGETEVPVEEEVAQAEASVGSEKKKKKKKKKDKVESD